MTARVINVLKATATGDTGSMLHSKRIAWVCAVAQYWAAILYLFCTLVVPQSNEAAVGCGVLAVLIALLPVCYALIHKRVLLLFSCVSAFNIAPIWFLYLEAITPGYDAYAYILPALRMEALFWVAVFLLFVNTVYLFFWRVLSEFSINAFAVLDTIKPKPVFYQRATLVCFTLPLVGFLYVYQSFDLMWIALTAGRSGTDLVKESTGTLSGLLVPINSIWQLTPLFGAIAFVASKRTNPLSVLSLVLGIMVSFFFFLSGSRGTMMFVAAPLFLFVFYYNWDRGLKFWAVATVTLFLLIGIMELQVRFRGNLLNVIVDPTRAAQDLGYRSATTFDPTESHRDNNMYLLCLMVQGYPAKYSFAGFHDLFTTLVNPIPRAIWPGKPYNIGAMDLSQQAAFVFDGPLYMGTTSLSYSVVGEAYQADGTFGLFVYALLYATFLLFFDGIIHYSHRNNPISVGILGVGVYLAFWGFRALFALVTFSYPIIGLIIFIKAVHFLKSNANHVYSA